MTPNDRYLFCAYVIPVGLVGLTVADLFWDVFRGLLAENALPPFVLVTVMPYTLARWAGRCWRCRAWASQANPLLFWPSRRCGWCGASLDHRGPARTG